jgi:plastocyanin
MSQDTECAAMGQARTEEPLTANVFVYVKRGLEGKQFPPPTDKVTIDQKGCWFGPRVLGIRPGQTLRVTNSDPVSHNIHPEPKFSREWNQNQPPESPALERRFLKPEVMVPVRCNIHRWMRAWIGVVDHPYFAVTQADGKFELRDVPPGRYVIEAWHERFGRLERTFTLEPSGAVQLAFEYAGN